MTPLTPDLPDPEALLVHLNEGKRLDDTDGDKISELLSASEDAPSVRGLSLDDRYAYLSVLGRTRDPQYQPLLERALDSRDPLTVGHVLEILCLEWERTEEYLERVIQFALGAPWDEDQDVQLAAIRILGEFVAPPDAESEVERSGEYPTSKRRVIELLFTVFDDPSCEHWTRQGAYYGLLRASGVLAAQLPGECVQLDFEKDIDSQRIETLRAQMRNDLELPASQAAHIEAAASREST